MIRKVVCKGAHGLSCFFGRVPLPRLFPFRQIRLRLVEEFGIAYAHLPVGMRDRAEVDAFVTLIEDEVERAAPGFRDVVVARSVQSSADLQDANPSLEGGALNGGTAALHQQLVLRPTPGLGRADTPFPGLFLAGSSAHPGGGVHGACGANAARAALLRARVGPGVYDRAVGAAQRALA